jgi:P4 family phage/plasmid primase-like protien
MDELTDGEWAAEEQQHDADLRAATFFGKEGLNVQRLAVEIADGARLVLGHDGRLYRYLGGVYRPDGDTYVRVRTRELLGERCKRRHFDEVLAWFRAHYPAVGERPPARWINCTNGLLDWHTLQLHPHDPDVLSTVQIPVAWNPDAACPTIDRYLAEDLPADAIDFALEIMGYSTYCGNPFRKAILLLGVGRNGKTIFLGLVLALVGAENASAVPLQVFAENRFAPAELYLKLANVCGDLDARAIRRTDTFKMITGGDPVLAERKYGHPFKFAPFALPLFSANEAPISSDQSEAWFDRWIIVPFERRFTEEEADPHLLDKLTTPSELEGLLVQAVHALRRLMTRGHFAIPDSVQQAGHRYRDRLDTVRAFVAEECTLDPDAWTPRSQLYGTYRNWAQEGGRLPVSAATFNDHLRRLDGIEEAGRKGIRGWSGINHTNTSEPQPEPPGSRGSRGSSVFSLYPHARAGEEGKPATPATPATPTTQTPNNDSQRDPELQRALEEHERDQRHTDEALFAPTDDEYRRWFATQDAEP